MQRRSRRTDMAISAVHPDAPHHLSRREFIRRSLAVGGGLAAASLLAGAPTRLFAAANVSFMVWSYSIETIQDNIKNFEGKNPGVSVKVQDFSWFDYHDVMAARFVGGNAPDVAYSSDHWLQEWVSANWIVPLDEVHPAFKDYEQEFAPYALQP